MADRFLIAVVFGLRFLKVGTWGARADVSMSAIVAIPRVG